MYLPFPFLASSKEIGSNSSTGSSEGEMVKSGSYIRAGSRGDCAKWKQINSKLRFNLNQLKLF